jgi:hypothetical protein
MKTWPIAVVALLCLLVGGCRTDPAIVLLERENRMLEDEIYRLRGVIEDYQQGLAPSCGEIVEGDVLPAESPPLESLHGGRGFLAPPKNSKEEADHNVTAPRVVPGEAEPSDKLPETLQHPAGIPHKEHGDSRSPTRTSALSAETAPPGNPDADRSGHGLLPAPLAKNRSPADSHVEVKQASAEEPVPFADSREASEIKLYRELTGGYDFDEQPGDEGIQAVIEIRDRNGQSLVAPGDVSIAVFDPALEGEVEGEASRIARWDFPAEVTAEMFCTDGKKQALFLEAPWPGAPPQHKKLHLFVRYNTRDGRTLQVDQPIEIALRGERIVRNHTPKTREEESRPHIAEDSSSKASADRAAQEEPVPSSLTAALPHPPRTTPHENAPRLTRPVWKPDRR